MKHRAQQGGLVFAIAVLVSENFRGRMRLKAANSNFDGYIMDLALRIGRKCFHLCNGICETGGEFGDLLLNGGGGGASCGGYSGMPDSEIVPGSGSLSAQFRI